MSLFNQTLFLVINTLAAVSSAAFIWFLRGAANFKRKLIIACGIAVTALIVALLVVNHLFTLQNTPTAAFAVFFGFALLISLVIMHVRDGGKRVGLGILSALFVAILGFLTANNFYHYYPTVGSAFDNNYSLYNSKNAIVTTASNPHKFQANISVEQILNSTQTDNSKIYNAIIPGPVSGFTARQAIIDLPPAYLNNKLQAVHFPVLILLNGAPGSPDEWLHGGNLQAVVDNFSARHDGVAPVIIVPDHSGSFANDTECVDSSRGNIEQYLTIDVPNYIKQNFNVSHDPRNWGIGGSSEGGMCAAMLTLRHQDIYQHFLDVGGEPTPILSSISDTIKTLFNGSKQAFNEHSIDWLLEHRPLDSHVTGQFAIGKDDDKKLVAQMKQTFQIAKSKKLNATLELIPNGGHSWAVVSQSFKDALPALSYYLGATQCETTCSK